MAGEYRIREMVDRWCPGVFAIMAIVKFFQLVGRMKIRRREDGWRRAARAFMYGEHTKFTLGTFSLDIWSDVGVPGQRTLKDTSEHVADRLYLFLSGEEAAHDKVCLEGAAQFRARKEYIDITLARYSADGDLIGIEPRLDPCGRSFNDIDRNRMDMLIVETFNSVRHLSDRKRTVTMMRRLKARSKKVGEMEYAERVMTSIFLQFESDRSKGVDRFDEPDFISRLHPGLGLMNIMCILRDDLREADMWFHTNHISIDGVPALEMLERQREHWGVRTKIVYPRIGKGVHFPLHRISTGKREVYRAGSLLDFSRLRDVRTSLKGRLGGRIGGDIPPIALLGWCMEHHEAFRGKKLHIPVDLPETADRERTLGFIFVRPSRFFRDRDPEQAFVDYVRYFNETASRARQREHVNQCFMDAVSYSPLFVFHLTRALLPGALEEYLGSMGLSVVRTSYVATAVMPDVNRDGYVVFSNFNVPDEDGGLKGYISVAGYKYQVEGYSEALADILGNVDGYLQFPA